MVGRLGQQLGNYRLLRPLGQGNFAEVYLGEHVALGTMAAIKILHTRVSEEHVAQFRQEARLLASLRHPHIVRVLDFGLDEQMPYLVMDYAPHGTLRTRHARGTPLPVSVVVGYVKQIAEALQYAHDRKVVHRDIKPENMLLGEKNEILLSDFGIAVIAQSSRYQSTKDTAGTITYMAPEQIEAHPRAASDQYSLGIVAYEWLCGTQPFHGSVAEIAIKHKVTAPPSLRKQLPTLSFDVEHVVLIALAKLPEERFASVSAFARALEQASQVMLPTDRQHHLDALSPPYPLPPPSQSAEPLVTAHPDSSVPRSAIQTPGQTQGSAPGMPHSLASTKTTDKPVLSRRVVLIGAAGVVVAIGAFTAGVFVGHQQSLQDHVVASPSRTVTAQGPAATPQNQPVIYRAHSDSVETVAWSPNGQQIASGSADRIVQVWNANDGSGVFTYSGHSEKVETVAWSLDGQRIASGSADTTVQVWNISNGSNIITYKGHNNKVKAVAWSLDGQRIVSCSDDKTVQVWNASNGSHIITYLGHSGPVNAVAWSPDGMHIASGSDDKTVQVWNASNGITIITCKGHSNPVNAVVWSPDGVHIASGSDDKTVQVWNASDGSKVFAYQGHSDVVNAVAWSPDGKQIVSGSSDKTAQVWNANDGNHVFTYPKHSSAVNAVAWSPDGKQIASGSDDKTAQVWHVG